MLKRMFEYGAIHKENGKKYDLILVLIILFTALILWGILQLTMQPGDVLSISYDGEVLGQIPLKGSGNRYYLVQYENAVLIELTDSQAEEYVSTNFSMDGDYNLFICREDGTVRMMSASCPDQICVNHREIMASMDNIICLPHRLVLEIVSDRDGKTEGLDGMAY